MAIQPRPGPTLLRIAPGQALPDHSHTSAERMMLAAGPLTVKYRGAEEITLKPGAHACGPAGLPHRAACVSEQPCVLFIAFDGPVDAMAAGGDVEWSPRTADGDFVRPTSGLPRRPTSTWIPAGALERGGGPGRPSRPSRQPTAG